MCHKVNEKRKSLSRYKASTPVKIRRNVLRGMRKLKQDKNIAKEVVTYEAGDLNIENEGVTYEAGGY